MRSRLWLLILREFPFPLRWIGTEIVRLVEWADSTIARVAKGLRDAPAWYLVSTIGSLAVVLTLSMFVSLIGETSGQKVRTTARGRIEPLTRQDLEKTHDWSVQDRWRLGHLFLADRPNPGPRNIPIDSRLTTTLSTAKTASKASRGKYERKTPSRVALSPRQPDTDLEVRLELSRPKKAQQGNRMADGTVLSLGPDSRFGQDKRIRNRDPRVLVQAAWNFASECDPQEYVSRPARRPILVPLPEPETELPPVVVKHERPDLAFELDMVRHFSVAGRFPPGSHVVSHSNHRSASDIGHAFSSELVSHEEGPWTRHHPHHDHAAGAIAPYAGLGTHAPPETSYQLLDEYNPDLPAVANVALRLNVEVPMTVTAGKIHRLGMMISNEGHDSISRIEIRDSLAGLNTIVGAEPDAERESVINPETGEMEPALHRELLNLIPGERQEMSLRWIPNGHSQQFRRVQVIAHAEVSTETEVVQPDPVQQMPSVPPERVEHRPAVACDIEHLDRVTVGKEVELQITVRNTGNTTLHHVKVAIDVPEQLTHSQGRKFVFDAGNLPVSGRNRTIVRLAAQEKGDAISRIHVDSDESVHAKGQLTIHVDDRRKPKAPLPQVSTPQPAAKRQESVTSSAWVPSGVCCCQKPVVPPTNP